MKSFIVKRIFLYISILSILTGCAAVWGGSYKIKEENEFGVTFQYDSALNSSAMMQKMAMKHCEKSNKKAEIQSARMPGLLLGIIEEKYSCVEKTTEN